MVEKVILEGQSAEDLIALFRTESPVVSDILQYFQPYCDCDIVEWIIAQLEANNEEVREKIEELIAAYDPYPNPRIPKFPVHGQLTKTFCEGRDLKGYYAVNSQGLQSYDKRIIVANSPLCGNFIIKDTFRSANGVENLEQHDATVGINVYRDGSYVDQLPTRPIEVLIMTEGGLRTTDGFKYFGDSMANIFIEQGFSYVESIPWTKNRIEMSMTAYFPLGPSSPFLADWPIEMSLGFGFGSHATNFLPGTTVPGTTTAIFSFHRYNQDAVDEKAADPGYDYGSRFDPRDRAAFFACNRNSASGFAPNLTYYLDDSSSSKAGTSINQAIDLAISNNTAEGTYQTLTDAYGVVPNFFCKEKRDAGDLLGYELTVSIRIDASSKTLKAYVNGVECATCPFTIDMREFSLAWFPQVYITGNGGMENTLITDFTVKEYE